MNKAQLEAAAQKGIISKNQVEDLWVFFQDQGVIDQGLIADGVGEATSQGEELRFIRSFGDVFISLGIVIVSFAISKIAFGGFAAIVPFLVLLFLAETLVGQRRLVLPGMTLLGAMLYFANDFFMALPLGYDEAALVASIGMIVLSGLFYWRYKMPFAFVTMAAGALLFFHRFFGLDSVAYPLIFAVYGAVVFLIAMMFDAKDVKRQNRFSDTGFWLHMLAAPLIAKGVMFSVFQAGLGMPLREFVVIGFFLVFFLIALFVDRRALMVSSLLFALAALVSLFKTDLIMVNGLVWIVFTGLGLVMIFVGVNWYAIRSLLFGGLKQEGLARLVPSFEKKVLPEKAEG